MINAGTQCSPTTEILVSPSFLLNFNMEPGFDRSSAALVMQFVGDETRWSPSNAKGSSVDQMIKYNISNRLIYL
jgi:hypothetical protein